MFYTGYSWVIVVDGKWLEFATDRECDEYLYGNNDE